MKLYWLSVCRILYFQIPHNTLCLPPQILHKLLFSDALGDTAYSQEHLKTMVYAKFGGQTKCFMGNSKIEDTIIILYIYLLITIMTLFTKSTAQCS